MSSKAIATRYAGNRVRLTTDDLPTGNHHVGPPMPPNDQVFGRVVGYDQLDPDRIVIQFEHPGYNNLAWPDNHSTTFTVPNHMLLTDANGIARFWSVSLQECGLHSVGGNYRGAFALSKKEKKKTLAKVKAYPNTCTACHSPARTICGAVMCSNVNCKSRKAIKHYSKNAKVGKYIKCPTCNGRAINCRQRGYDTPIRFTATCLKAHKWDHVLKDNDIIASSLAPGGRNDQIWTDAIHGWQPY